MSEYAACFSPYFVAAIRIRTFMLQGKRLISSTSVAAAVCAIGVLLSFDLLTYIWRIVTSDAVTQLSVTSSSITACCHGDPDHAVTAQMPCLRDIMLHLQMLPQKPTIRNGAAFFTTAWRPFLHKPSCSVVTRDFEAWTTTGPQLMWMTWPQFLKRGFSSRYGIKSTEYVLKNAGNTRILSET
jgi:hypothetical protein